MIAYHLSDQQNTRLHIVSPREDPDHSFITRVKLPSCNFFVLALFALVKYWNVGSCTRMWKLSVLTQETDFEMDRYMEKRLKTTGCLWGKRKLSTHYLFHTE